jgi:hypothetical protein
MPPPGGMAGMGDSFLGFSATIASVVISSPAIEAAPCSAVRTTLVGSIIPLETKSPVFSLLCVEAMDVGFILTDLADDATSQSLVAASTTEISFSDRGRSSHCYN